MKDMKDQLIAQAQADLAAYPQYEGKFAGYVLVRMKRKVRTKMGLAFERGELAIADPNKEPDGVFVYSRRNRINTLVAEEAVEWL